MAEALTMSSLKKIKSEIDSLSEEDIALLREWLSERAIYEVGGIFVTSLIDLTAGETWPSDSAEFSVGDVSDDDRKLLFLGPPGTGKTMTDSVLSGELGIPLFTIQLDGLITKYLGETAAKLRLIFEEIQWNRTIQVAS